MKLAPVTFSLFLATASAFSAAPTFVRQSTSLNGFDLSGNSWKPDSEKSGSTDTGDYFPEGYDGNDGVDFSDGQGGGAGNRDGPQLPGMENLGADAVVQGGIDVAPDIPAGMEFTPSSVPDGEYTFNVASSGTGKLYRFLL
jgi:hypothetical protein